MPKTIKQLADELGVSKTTVSRHLQRLPQHVAQRCGGRVAVSDEGVELLISTFNAKTATHQTATCGATRGGAALRSDVAVLAQYEARIKEKDDEIAYLRDQVRVEQQLRLVADQKILQLEAPQEKKGFWARLTGR